MADILLVHGAWHGPWCWERFAGRLTRHGHEVRTVELRDHDQRPGRIWGRLGDYVGDVRREAPRFAAPPVLVGHSMGGLVVQRYAEREPAGAIVLMASLPVGGTLPAVARLALRHPVAVLKVNLLWSLRPLIATPSLVRELFFAPGTPDEVVDSCMARMQDESYPAFVDTLLALRRRRTACMPALVLGAGRDGFLTAAETVRTASAYRTEAETFPAMGHDMMLDEGWQDVADRIDLWLRCRYAPVTSRAKDSNALR